MGAAVAAETWRGWYLDGRTAARRAATVGLLPHAVVITTEDGLARSWRFADVRQTQGFYPGEPMRLERGGDYSEAVIVDDRRFARALRGAAGAHRHGLGATGHRTLRALTVAGAGAMALLIVVAMYRWGVSSAAGLIAEAVPVRWEAQLGEQTFELIRSAGRVCTDPRLQSALDGIAGRLLAVAPTTPYQFRVAVLDVSDVNAIALPGGRVVVFRGLLEITDSPEMLAGVLAHEIQHVLRRHATRAIVRHAAASGLISVVTQDAHWVAGALSGADVFTTLRYGRAAEEEADREGLRMLQAAAIDPRGMLAFFRKIAVDDDGAGDRGGFWGLLATHPATGSRIDALAALARPGGVTQPIALSGSWEEIRAMCVAP